MLLLPLGEKEEERYNEERNIGYSFGIVPYEYDRRGARVYSAGGYKE